MVACTAARETMNRSDDSGVVRELGSLWVLVQAIDDIPRTPETNASYVKARQLLDRRLKDIGLDPTALRRFFDGANPELIKRQLEKSVSCFEELRESTIQPGRERLRRR